MQEITLYTIKQQPTTKQAPIENPMPVKTNPNISPNIHQL